MLRRTKVLRTVRFSNGFGNGNARWFCVQQKETPNTKKRSKGFRNVVWNFPVVCFGLTIWQYQRLNWKRDLISNLKQRFTIDLVEFPHELLLYVLYYLEFNYCMVLRNIILKRY